MPADQQDDVRKASDALVLHVEDGLVLEDRGGKLHLGDGKTVVQRVLWIPVEQISGPRKTGLEQQHIDFRKVDEPLPEDWNGEGGEKK